MRGSSARGLVGSSFHAGMRACGLGQGFIGGSGHRIASSEVAIADCRTIRSPGHPLTRSRRRTSVPSPRHPIARWPLRRIAPSLDRWIAGSLDRSIAGSRIAGSLDRSIAGSLIAGSLDRWIAGSPHRLDRCIAGSLARWLAGSLARCARNCPARRAVGDVFRFECRRDCSASPVAGPPCRPCCSPAVLRAIPRTASPRRRVAPGITSACVADPPDLSPPGGAPDSAPRRQHVRSGDDVVVAWNHQEGRAR